MIETTQFLRGFYFTEIVETPSQCDDTDIEKFFFFDNSFEIVVLPAPDGEDNITIIPSSLEDI